MESSGMIDKTTGLDPNVVYGRTIEAMALELDRVNALNSAQSKGIENALRNLRNVIACQSVVGKEVFIFEAINALEGAKK